MFVVLVIIELRLPDRLVVRPEVVGAERDPSAGDAEPLELLAAGEARGIVVEDDAYLAGVDGGAAAGLEVERRGPLGCGREAALAGVRAEFPVTGAAEI